MRLLLIEDDVRRNRPLVSYLTDIEKWGVLWGKTPNEGLGLLQTNQSEIDVVLLDIMMPADGSVDKSKSDLGINTGILLLEKIHAITKGEIPIIVFTAGQDLHQLKEDKRVAFYLKKPMSAKGIVVVITNALKRKK